MSNSQLIRLTLPEVFDIGPRSARRTLRRQWRPAVPIEEEAASAIIDFATAWFGSLLLILFPLILLKLFEILQGGRGSQNHDVSDTYPATVVPCLCATVAHKRGNHPDKRGGGRIFS